MSASRMERRKMSANNNHDNWEEMFQRLLEFRFEEGHWMVPNPYLLDQELGQWVAKQQRDFAEVYLGRRELTSLTVARENKLTQVGFPWQPIASVQQKPVTLGNFQMALPRESQVQHQQPQLPYQQQKLQPQHLQLQGRFNNSAVTCVPLTKEAAVVPVVLPTEPMLGLEVASTGSTEESKKAPEAVASLNLLCESAAMAQPMQDDDSEHDMDVNDEQEDHQEMDESPDHNVLSDKNKERAAQLLVPERRKRTTKTTTLLFKDFVPGDDDVICGRGNGGYNHTGNERFRKIISRMMDEYHAGSKGDKSFIVSFIIAEVRSKNAQGGFVKRDPSTGRWYEIGDNIVRGKVRQAFREAPTKDVKEGSSSSNDVASAGDERESKQIMQGIQKFQRGKRKHPQKETTLPPDFSPSQNDVVIGVEKKGCNFPGNDRFRKMIENRTTEYATATCKVDKSFIVSSIVAEIRASSPGGGFVKRSTETGRWYEIGDFLAREKTSQALRNALEGRYRSSTVAKRKRRQEKKNQKAKQGGAGKPSVTDSEGKALPK